jgi:aminoglycoside/choline kinase family phosphotransferase
VLRQEFHSLAKKVDSFRKTIIHRDFQSQNIMVGRGDIPRVIDYQGARIGPPAYDIASILWDPYHNIENDLRERLIAYYIEGMKAAGCLQDEAGFMLTMLPCRLQRHMQALGAYGFLSKVKGKTYFMKHVPLALRYLKEEAEAAKDEYPAISGLVLKVDGKAEN